MREEFEKLPSISCILDRGVYFDQENNMYKGGSDEDYFWVNGAWYAYQEQQDKIKKIESIVENTWDVDLMIQEIKEILK